MTSRYRSPAGEMIIGSYRDRLCLCDWLTERRRDIIDRRICRHLNASYADGMSEMIFKACTELDEYFAGLRSRFTIDPLFTGSTFQCRVWFELMKIPYGTTVSYAEIARRIGNPGAVRAVAAANATNPISIFVPCHRVIGSDNSLTGYAGGLDAKRYLIALETRHADKQQPSGI